MKVEVIKKTKWQSCPEIVTIACEYPRFIHGELMTHRLFSRNCASTRAVPFSAALKNLRENPADVVYWGKSMSGMQAREELSGWRLFAAKTLWIAAREACVLVARAFNAIGLHKQIANRILEPFQNISVLITSTEWDNFFALRTHESAQPEFQTLARMIEDEISSTPAVESKYHIPFFSEFESHGGNDFISLDSSGGLVVSTKEDALKISASICAQWSYRKFDPSMEKANKIWSQLVESKPVHASPTEHQAWAMDDVEAGYVECCNPDVWDDGITHIDKRGRFWSGNFRGWVQHRQVIKGNAVNGMIEDV